MTRRLVTIAYLVALTAIAADFTGDGLLDVITNAGSTRLFIAPDWTPVTIGSGKGSFSTWLTISPLSFVL